MIEKEINEAVAVKLGWTKKEKYIMKNGRHGGWIWINKRLRRVGSCRLMPLGMDYCTDIRAAWEIIPIGIWNIIETNSKKWRASCWMSKTKKWYWAEADTAPMAICLAFLKLEDK